MNASLLVCGITQPQAGLITTIFSTVFPLRKTVNSVFCGMTRNLMWLEKSM
jgi:hypothetical protein